MRVKWMKFPNFSSKLYGEEMVAHLSRILNKCCEGEGEMASSIAIEAISVLCSEGIIDIKTTWSTLAPKYLMDKRTKTVKRWISSAPTPTISSSLFFAACSFSRPPSREWCIPNITRNCRKKLCVRFGSTRQTARMSRWKRPLWILWPSSVWRTFLRIFLSSIWTRNPSPNRKLRFS